MAARLTDKQKKKIVADYLETGSYRATARKNRIADGTVKRIVLECSDIEQKVAQKKEENTADILAYMESQKGLVCEIIGKGLAALNDPEKLAEATPAQITTISASEQSPYSPAYMVMLALAKARPWFKSIASPSALFLFTSISTISSHTDWLSRLYA